jgi:glycosyltransferase involved in cell wall biosynthesis
MPSDSTPLVSVIVTTRNSARTLDRCLAGIREQTHPRVELIVVDNSSTDDTFAIAQRHADQVVTLGPERSAQRNHGAEISSGAYLLFIDSDMVLSREVVADALRSVLSSGLPGAIIPEESFGEGFWTKCRILERNCYTGDDLVEAARFYTREAFFAAEGFDLELNGPEDWDLSRRIAAGRRLPRTTANILHDEGRTSLRTAFVKRRYYAPGYLRYLRKHGRGVAGQGNPLLRPAFLRNWRELGRHPILAGGMLSLKAVEVAAVLQVAAEQSLLGRSGRSTERGRQVYR